MRRVEAKGDCCAELLASKDWDLFVTVFADSHCIGHQCWHLHDPEHRDHDPAIRAELGDPMKAVYRAIDRQIGRLLAQLDGAAWVIFLTGPGMGPICSGNHKNGSAHARPWLKAKYAFGSVPSGLPP